jgi:hypothetical protein
MAAPACPEMTTSNGHQDERKSVVMYALPGMIGHLVSTVELGKLFAEHGLKDIVVLAGQADDEDLNGAADSFLVGLAASHPGLSVHHLHVPTHDHVAHIFELARASNSALGDFLPGRPPPRLLLRQRGGRRRRARRPDVLLLHLVRRRPRPPLTSPRHPRTDHAEHPGPRRQPAARAGPPAEALLSLANRHFLALSEQLCSC